MATSSRIHLTPESRGSFSVPKLSQASADAVSKLLQENHEKHHIFFNSLGFHNHIAHHLLTTFALGATPEAIKRHYDNNASYQRPPEPVDRDIIDHKLGHPEEFKKYLGDERYYHDYLLFFQKEMDRLPGGYQDVVNEYLLKGDERADDMLTRLYGGLLHPIIHLGFGIEFEQPAIVAEGLAEAAVHGNYLKTFLFDAEKQANQRKKNSETSKTLVDLYHAVLKDDKVRHAAHWEDANKLRDGLMKRAPTEVVSYLSQWHATEADLERRSAEMHAFCAYFAGAAQHPPKQVKFDFVFIHSINCAVFFPTFLRQDWISVANKVRLVEWKGRIDLIDYLRTGAPDLPLTEITGYKPRQPNDGESGLCSWEGVFARAAEFDDDGHASKLVRTLALGQRVAAPFEGDGTDFMVKGENWLREANMAIDSVEDDGETWVRDCGFDQAWRGFHDRSQAKL